VHRGNSASSVRHREVRDGGLAVIYVTVEAGWAKELFFSQLSAAASLSRVAGRESRVLPPQTETAMARCRSISSEGDPYFILAREGAFYRDVARRIRLLLLKKFARTFKRERERERERERITVHLAQCGFITGTITMILGHRMAGPARLEARRDLARRQNGAQHARLSRLIARVSSGHCNAWTGHC